MSTTKRNLPPQQEYTPGRPPHREDTREYCQQDQTAKHRQEMKASDFKSILETLIRQGRENGEETSEYEKALAEISQIWERAGNRTARRQAASTQVDHPNYYQSSGGECIEGMIEAFGADAVASFCACNAYKYLFRMGMKGDASTDIRKAQWYIGKHNELTHSQLTIDTVMRAVEHFKDN